MLNLFYSSIIFLFGLAVGSFLNCLIYRLKEGESFLKGRSYCPYCKHILSWQDLIPVLSFLILRGKCKYCQKSISLQYPLVELITGTLFISIFNSQNLLVTGYLLLVTCFLIVIFVYDLKHYIIPDKVIYPVIGIVFLYRLFEIFGFILDSGFKTSYFKTLTNPFFSALLASIFFLAIVLVSQGKWMGVGDIKLAFFMGLFLGWPNILVALFLAFLIGAIIGVGLMISGKRTLKSEIPFGPFLVTGTFLALFWGSSITNWYLSLFFGI